MSQPWGYSAQEFPGMQEILGATLGFCLPCHLKVKVKVAQSCPTLCNPIDYTVHGILQARILEWVAFSFSRGSSQPRDQTQVSHMAGRFFTSWATREAQKRGTQERDLLYWVGGYIWALVCAGHRCVCVCVCVCVCIKDSQRSPGIVSTRISWSDNLSSWKKLGAHDSGKCSLF